MFERKVRGGVTSRLRLRGHDYADSHTYFVTLCTEHRTCLFGSISQGVLEHSPAGLVIDSWLAMVPGWFPGVLLDAFVIMPNHAHMIISINSDPGVTERRHLSTIIQWLKTKTTYDYILGVRMEDWPPFDGRLWQRGYYDRIVRSDRELQRFRRYIADNPQRWSEDENYVAEFNR